ncbi:hypothetical protein F5148DRAFT_1147602 [Russula earlei]|uniref:Uncharacterized protein n=1 Tax=Russula earlei TaxID=71964 RepID=A0ACC0UFP1_9AGAM|nr:hypothetical protein F5148DRAFT_1147602 [Russula earlei]
MSSPAPSPLASPVPEVTSVGKKSPARSKASRSVKSGATKKATPAKKSSTTKKPAVKKSASKPSPTDHPSWKDIIKEAITQHPEDARSGVSRSAIKKASLLVLVVARIRLTDVSFQYAEEKYKLDMSSASNLHQLNLALTRGAENETFVFPKGPSGKVKLASKRAKAPTDAKENTKPPSKRAPSTKKATEAGKVAPSKRVTTSKTKTSSDKTTKKPAAIPKKAPTVTKKIAATKKPSAKKVSSTKNDAKKASLSSTT